MQIAKGIGDMQVQQSQVRPLSKDLSSLTTLERVVVDVEEESCSHFYPRLPWQASPLRRIVQSYQL